MTIVTPNAFVVDRRQIPETFRMAGPLHLMTVDLLLPQSLRDLIHLILVDQGITNILRVESVLVLMVGTFSLKPRPRKIFQNPEKRYPPGTKLCSEWQGRWGVPVKDVEILREAYKV